MAGRCRPSAGTGQPTPAPAGTPPRPDPRHHWRRCSDSLRRRAPAVRADGRNNRTPRRPPGRPLPATHRQFVSHLLPARTRCAISAPAAGAERAGIAAGSFGPALGPCLPTAWLLWLKLPSVVDNNLRLMHGGVRGSQSVPALRARTSRHRGVPSLPTPRAVKGTVVTVNPDAVRSLQTACSGQ